MSKTDGVIEHTVLPAEVAESKGFKKFNPGNHLCVDLPQGHSTISVKLPNGRRISMAFVPYSDENLGCMDIEYESPDKLPEEFGNKGQDYFAQRIIGFSHGRNSFRTSVDDEKPTHLFTLLLNPERKDDSK